VPLRLFVALDPPAPARDALAAAQARMRAALGAAAREVKWVEPGNVHLTLQFLGAVDEALAPAVEGAVQAAAAAAQPLSLEVTAAGAVPSPRRPRVLWAGLSGDLAPLSALVADLGARLAPLGFPPESRPWSAHLTLGRARDPHGAAALAPAAAVAVAPAPWSAREVTLFRSHLSPKGPRYEPLARVPLGSHGP